MEQEPLVPEPEDANEGVQGGPPAEPRSRSMVAEAVRRMTETAEGDEELLAGGIAPPRPRSFLDVGLSRAFLTDLALKIIHYSGTPTSTQMSRRLGLSTSLTQQLMHVLSEEKFIEILSQTDLSSSNYHYRVSTRGQERVKEALDRSRYAGPAPVPAETYSDVLRRQATRRQPPARWRLKNMLEGMVVSEELEDGIGRAVFSGRPVLFYGPSGNGKSTILERFSQNVDGVAIIPHAIYSHGQVIRVFDSAVHVAAEDDGGDSSPQEDRFDHRWVLVKRPVVTMGAELENQSLDLTYDPLSGFYQAPLHIKAQGGVIIVDDLGRQRVEARVVLSRLLNPLERGRDTLTFATGEKVTLPFNAQVIFSTNMPVEELGEEALLRRLAYKVEFGNPSPQTLAQMLQLLCQQWGVIIGEGAIEHVMQAMFNHPGFEARAASAGEVLSIVMENADFDGVKPALNDESFDKAFQLFVAQQVTNGSNGGSKAPPQTR